MRGHTRGTKITKTRENKRILKTRNPVKSILSGHKKAPK
jgi:hypothetical protein